MNFKFIKFVLNMCLYASFLLFAIMFVVAYLDPSKSVLMTINMRGEADIELVLLLILLTTTTASILIKISENWSEHKKKSYEISKEINFRL